MARARVRMVGLGLTSTMEERSVYSQRKGEAHGSRSWRDTAEMQGRYASA